jgi:diguanylate cyclase (GGDEF)-like protein
MKQQDDLRNDFQRSIIVPVVFLALMAFASVYFLYGIFTADNFDKNTAFTQIICGFIVVFMSFLILHIFSIKPLLIKLQNTALNYKDLANRDTLTGLMNRNALIHSYFIMKQLSSNQSLESTIVIVDVDDFKKINDQYGHACGDFVLQHISTLIKHNIRTSDQCFRIGGEEFCILLKDTPISTSAIILEKLRTTIASTPCHFGQSLISTTCTLGIASINYGVTLEKNMMKADKALYKGKNAGKNMIFVNNENENRTHRD